VKGTQQSVQVKKSELGKEDVSVEREHKLESREGEITVQPINPLSCTHQDSCGHLRGGGVKRGNHFKSVLMP